MENNPVTIKETKEKPYKGKKYKILYADPPYRYKVYSRKGMGRSAEDHYHTMDIDEIRSLPVGGNC